MLIASLGTCFVKTSNEGNTYGGEENDLQLSAVLEPTFRCLFDLSNFPFDTQNCNIDFERFPKFKNYTYLQPLQLEYTGTHTAKTRNFYSNLRNNFDDLTRFYHIHTSKHSFVNGIQRQELL